jgi:hypothetical protein
MKHTGIPIGPEMELVEYLLRASKSLPFNGYCLEIVLYSIRIGNRGFAYTLNEPLRLGKDFQSFSIIENCDLCHFGGHQRPKK